MPQLNPLDWAPQLIWLLITFGVLYLLMVYVALPRIGAVIEARAARIAKDLAQAEKFRRETEEAIAAYEQALAEAKQKAHAIIDAGRAKLKVETAEERARLERDLAKKSAEAEARITEEKNSALKDVNVEAAEVASALVEKLIGVTSDEIDTRLVTPTDIDLLVEGLPGIGIKLGKREQLAAEHDAGITQPGSAGGRPRK